MASKQVLKTSEARTLIYLDNVPTMFKNASEAHHRLKMDYNYLIRILKGMVLKEWIVPIRRTNKVFYELTNIAPLNVAKEVLESGNKEM